MISFHLVDESVDGAIVNVTKNGNVYTLNYPCYNSSHCTNYYSTFPAGIYKFELYGGSGGFKNDQFMSTFIDPFNNNKCFSEVKKYGGNTVCHSNIGSRSGAGGYTSGVIHLYENTLLYFSVGGQGEYSYNIQPINNDSYAEINRPKGGYNGGGSASNYFNSNNDFSGAAAGGGATDIRAEKNDYFHRIIVAGGGGGGDNQAITSDDGSGGAGGGIQAQGYWNFGSYNSECIANQSFGFSFGNGETSQSYVLSASLCPRTADRDTDRSGAGGGWFGGFASHSGSAGSGGGSSFVLTKQSEIPEGNISVYDGSFKLQEQQPYAFSVSSKYVMRNDIIIPGIWSGNGKVVITVFDVFSHSRQNRIHINYHCIIIILHK